MAKEYRRCGCAISVTLLLMANHRRRRGRDTERIVAEYLQAQWEGAHANGASAAGSDVLGIPFLDVEIKAVAKLNLPAAFKQSEKRRKANQKSLIILRLNGQGDPSEFIACMRLKEILPLLKEMPKTTEPTRCTACGSWMFDSCKTCK